MRLVRAMPCQKKKKLQHRQGFHVPVRTKKYVGLELPAAAVSCFGQYKSATCWRWLTLSVCALYHCCLPLRPRRVGRAIKALERTIQSGRDSTHSEPQLGFERAHGCHRELYRMVVSPVLFTSVVARRKLACISTHGNRANMLLPPYAVDHCLQHYTQGFRLTRGFYRVHGLGPAVSA